MRQSPVGEHVRQAEGLVVGLAVQVEEVGDVDVGEAEGLVLRLPRVAVRVVQDLDPGIVVG